MDESAPAWTTGDMEPPAGSRDMGGWTMKVYTAQQQKRLGIDAEGTPLHPAQDGSVPATHRIARVLHGVHRSVWVVGGLLGLAAVGLALVVLWRRRRAAKSNAIELEAVFNQLSEGNAESSAAQV